MPFRKLVLAAILAIVLVPAAGVARASSGDDDPQGAKPYKQPLETVKKDTPQDALVGYLGLNYGGGLYGGGVYIPDLFGHPKVYGASLLVGGAGVAATEFDLGYNPSFYDGLPVVSPDGSSNMYTLTMNGVLGPTFYLSQRARIRPYGLLGGGLMRSSISQFTDLLSVVNTKNLFTWDWGLGCYIYAVRQVGIRIDYRRFQAVGANKNELGWSEIKDWNYYRLTVGLALAF
jgi:hypothetical protein